jgi:hypothetical protein
MAIGWPVFDLALGLDALVRFLLLHRCEQRRCLGRIDDAADFQQLPDEILRHRSLLCGSRAREDSRNRG